MDYTQVLTAYKTLVNQHVGSKVSEDSIDPTDVAEIGIQLADLLLPILNSINDFAISGGTQPPDNSAGVDLDLYIQGGAVLKFWRKRNNVWNQEASVDLGIQIVDGVISVRASVSGQVVTVSAGSWAINNIIYNKAVQTQLTLTNADLNFNRIDSVLANNTGAIILLNGIASSNPTPPATPGNSVVVAYVYVPASSSGDLPFIADSNSSPTTVINDAITSFVKTWSSEKIKSEIDSHTAKVEKIDYTSASGVYSIDFTINNRQSFFPYPKIEIWSVDGSTDTLVQNVGIAKNRTLGLITNISLDGVFGSGYILIH